MATRQKLRADTKKIIGMKPKHTTKESPQTTKEECERRTEKN